MKVLFCAALTFEGVGFDTSSSGLFGLFGSWAYLWKSLYLGIIPGVLGVVSFAAVLKWLQPLVVALPGEFKSQTPDLCIMCPFPSMYHAGLRSESACHKCACAGTMEPLIGSSLGLALGIGSPPGFYTC